ncbi:MAG: C4-dicarboxylate ABC transporter, partial [Marinobacter sp.]
IDHIDGLADESLEKIKEASDEVTVTELNEEQVKAFRERAPEVEDEFIEMTGDSGKKLLEQFKKDLSEVQED